MWAIILACIPIPLTLLAAVVLAIIVLNQSGDGRNHGKGRAISALILVAVWVVVLIAVIAASVADNADRDTSGTVTQSGDVSVFDLRAGDCLPKGFPVDTEVVTLEVAACSVPHTLEVYAEFDLASGDFPGDAEVERLSQGGCLKRFETFVGVPTNDSSLEMYYLQPQESSWSADRAVTCLVGDSSPSTGTLENAGR